MSRWRANLPAYGAWAAGLLALFLLVYGGANWLAGMSGAVYRFHADWELALPFVPGVIFLYLSIGLALPMPLFLLERSEIRPYAVAFALATVIAGTCFVLFPAAVGFERPLAVPGYRPVFELIYRIDAQYNTLPSLHVAYATLTLLTVAARVRTRGLRPALWLWLAALCVAVILVRQHNVADVAAGIALGFCCSRYFERRAAARLQGSLRNRVPPEGTMSSILRDGRTASGSINS